MALGLETLGDIPFLGKLSRIGLETLGDIPFLGKLSRIGLEALSDISWGNGLKGLNQERWLLGVRVLSADYGPDSLLGRFRVRTPTRFYHLRKLAPFGWLVSGGHGHGSLRLGNLSLLRSTRRLRASLTNGRGIVHLLHLPQIRRSLHPSLFKGFILDLEPVKPAYPQGFEP